MNFNGLYELPLDKTTSDNIVQESRIEAIQANLTVKFYTPDAKVFTQSIPGFYSIEHIKKDLAKLFSCPKNVIDLLLREQKLPDETILGRCEPDKFGILEIKLISKDKHFKIPIENAYKHLTVPDILTVKVQKDGEEIRDVVVEIENRAIEKPYLGGYRHPVSGIQYHHGYSQTGPLSPELPPEMKNHRDTQTYFTRNRKVNRNCSKFTQVPTKKPTVCDKLLTPGPYETAEEREIRLEGKVKIIQRYFRAWQIKTRMKALLLELQRQIDYEAECDEVELQQIEAIRKKDIITKVFPVKGEDFSMLFNMVDRWKKAELERISEMTCGAARMAESYLLLEKEIEIIRSIDCLKRNVKKSLELKKVMDFFKEIGSPIEWTSDYKDIHISMDTLEAQKGREYHELYKDLCKKSSSKDECFRIYSRIKEYIKTHDSGKDGKEIVSLIDRMCELIATGLSDNFLGALKKRIEALVLHHFQLQERNKHLTDHMKKVSTEHARNNLVYCHSCQKLKPIESFTINARLQTLKICTTCKRLNKVEEPWIDLAPHKFILGQIRNYERSHNGRSSIVFILKDRDIHLIVNIWHGHSAISECNDIYQLRLIRWKKHEEWAPWNCILLTTEEAKAHLGITDLEAIYDQHFINHVFYKHALARIHFKHLTIYDNYYAKYKKGHCPPCETTLKCKSCLELEGRRCSKAASEEESEDITETTERSERTETTPTTGSSECSLKVIYKDKKPREPSDDGYYIQDF